MPKILDAQSFQFPVGMSNRSYVFSESSVRNPEIAFNSPWECRIGLTLGLVLSVAVVDIIFQFPVGMSNRSYAVRRNLRGRGAIFLSIPRGNVE